MMTLHGSVLPLTIACQAMTPAAENGINREVSLRSLWNGMFGPWFSSCIALTSLCSLDTKRQSESNGPNHPVTAMKAPFLLDSLATTRISAKKARSSFLENGRVLHEP